MRRTVQVLFALASFALASASTAAGRPEQLLWQQDCPAEARIEQTSSGGTVRISCYAPDQEAPRRPPADRSRPGTHPRHAPPASPAPPDCSGYAEKRVFLESQGWWWRRFPEQTGDDFGHVHMGTCFPHAQTVSGELVFDLRIILHDNPGRVFRLRGPNFQIDGLSWTCPPGETCTFWQRVVVDTESWTPPGQNGPRDGRQEMRFSAFVQEPDGNRLFQSTGWQVYLANGNPVDHYRNGDVVIARGWYTDAEYQNATLVDDDGALSGPVSGLWQPVISAARGSGGQPSDHHIVMIDPDFHAHPPTEGHAVLEGAGEADKVRLSIDTTHLTDGWHRLVIRADDDFLEAGGECAQNKGAPCDSTLSGLLVIWFEVRNGS